MKEPIACLTCVPPLFDLFLYLQSTIKGVFFWKIADRVTEPHLSFLRSSSVGKTKTAIIVTALTGWKRTRRKKKSTDEAQQRNSYIALSCA